MRGGRLVRSANAAVARSVLPGQQCPFAGDKQLCLPGRDTLAGELAEKVALAGSQEGDLLTKLVGQHFQRFRPAEQPRSSRVVMRSSKAGVGEHADGEVGHIAVVAQCDTPGVGQAGPCP